MTCTLISREPVLCEEVLRRELGRVIRRRRLERTLSQARFAELAQTHRPLVARAELGKAHTLTLHTLIRYASALGCTVSDLVREAEGASRAQSTEVSAL